MDQVLDNCAPGSIVIGSREDIKPAWVGEFLALRFGGVRVEEASSVYERTFVRKCVSELWPSLLVFGPSLEPNAAMVAFQTAYSAVFAIVVLLLASPLMLAAAALIRFGSRGPVLERQPRTGLHGVPFNLYRFRCRRDEDGACTRVGKVLKRLHLDALPCLFNVVRGEMSIVGPRAVYPLHDEQLSTQIPFYGHRHRVKPGLIGWAFVHPGDSIHDSVRELEYDLYYVENLSPILDSMVLLLSLKIFWLSVTSNSPEAISA
jgi:lipopolysaccharide/colanic/teichoic acid biosynthesis glycosyltransferase